MGGPLGVAILVMLIIGACIQVSLALYHQYIKRHRNAEKDADAIASELELQLQGELEDAVKSSSAILDTVTKDEQSRLSHLYEPLVRFDDDKSSWNAFKLDGRAQLQRLAKVITPNANNGLDPSTEGVTPSDDTLSQQKEPLATPLEHQQITEHLQLPLTVGGGPLGQAKAVLVNAKQYNRILKRRLTRKLIEDYFRSHPHQRKHEICGTWRRPRGPGGRFLTTEQLGRIESGLRVGDGAVA